VRNEIAYVAAAGLIVWLYLLLLRGQFWRVAPQTDLSRATDPDHWPAVVAVIPARNEADVIGRALATVLGQHYGGRLTVVLVDDESEDGTAARARAAADACDGAARLEIVRAGPRPGGWTGKMWAVAEGLAHADRIAPDAPFVWLTDADIAHHPGHLRRLVRVAELDRLDAVSRMVRLHCERFWERLLIPAFVFFFRKLFPFAWVNDPARRTAAAAGGCFLVRRDALRRIGGVAPVRNALIDDCALARALKREGRIRLGLANEAQSIRPYRLADIWNMVARTAFDQLGYSVLALKATVVLMLLAYVAPPAIALAFPWHESALASGLALVAWMLMAAVYVPTLRLYGRAPAAALLLPVAGLFYTLMTIHSALRHWAGGGGRWKSRTHDPRAR